MTQTEMTKFLDQINQAFSNQFNRLDQLEAKVKDLEDQVLAQRQKEAQPNAERKGPTASTGRGKRVQQAKEDA
jgi:uncharacterized coiled-coil protein SlyX